MRLPDWDTTWRTILLFVISAIVGLVFFFKGVLKNPRLDPDRIGQNTEAKS